MMVQHFSFVLPQTEIVHNPSITWHACSADPLYVSVTVTPSNSSILLFFGICPALVLTPPPLPRHHIALITVCVCSLLTLTCSHDLYSTRGQVRANTHPVCFLRFSHSCLNELTSYFVPANDITESVRSASEKENKIGRWTSKASYEGN